MEDGLDAVGLFGTREWTAEELAMEFRDSLKELGWSAVELADRMADLGDHRAYNTILRGINRVLDGQVKISGEMLALVRQMVRFRRRLIRSYEFVEWKKLGDNSFTTNLEDFRITLVPKTKNRWLVNMVHTSGYSPSWPRWQDNLEAAKNMAFLILDNAQNWLLELDQERVKADEFVRAPASVS
jgi:hypothetical protein